MAVNIKLSGLEKWLEQLEGNLSDALIDAGNEVRAEAIRLMGESTPHGKTYRRRGGEYRASAPGQPPQIDTGALARSLSVTLSPDGKSIEVGSDLPYAAIHEFGLGDAQERPFLRPALANSKDEILKIITSALK